jgi:hypothetical protein
MLEIGVLQRDLTRAATRVYSAEGDVESKWLALSPMARQAYILERYVPQRCMKALKTVESIYDLEVELQKDGVKQFVRLPKACLIFPPWDDLPTSSDERDEETKAYFVLLRNIFICEHF